jgi:hypothetical protein
MATVKLDPAKGIQIPNLTTTERNAISSPETGAIIWNTTTSEINQYNGSAWEITYTDTNTQIAGITSSADATAMTIGADENIGIGVVPKAWHSSGVALQVGAGGCVKGHTTDERVALLSNAYEAASDGNWKRVSTGLAANVNLDNGVFNFETGVTGSADSNITWTNPVQIDAEGIKFNGDTAAVNALDDYEEGTWTPALNGGSTPQASAPQGTYVKVGSLVTCHMMWWGFTATAVAAQITGLPFTSTGSYVTATIGSNTWTNNGASAWGYNASTIRVVDCVNKNEATGIAGYPRYISMSITYRTT